MSETFLWNGQELTIAEIAQLEQIPYSLAWQYLHIKGYSGSKAIAEIKAQALERNRLRKEHDNQLSRTWWKRKTNDN